MAENSKQDIAFRALSKNAKEIKKPTRKGPSLAIKAKKAELLARKAQEAKAMKRISKFVSRAKAKIKAQEQGNKDRERISTIITPFSTGTRTYVNGALRRKKSVLGNSTYYNNGEISFINYCALPNIQNRHGKCGITLDIPDKGYGLLGTDKVFYNKKALSVHLLTSGQANIINTPTGLRVVPTGNRFIFPTRKAMTTNERSKMIKFMDAFFL